MLSRIALGWDLKDVVVFGMVLATALTLVLTGHTSADSVIALIVGVVMKQPFNVTPKGEDEQG
jgi:divalent metal cation (Fe/Co/Zn/Cd) transporter